MAKVVTEISGEKLAFIQPLQDPALLNWFDTIFEYLISEFNNIWNRKDNEFSNQNTDISTSDDANNGKLLRSMKCTEFINRQPPQYDYETS